MPQLWEIIKFKPSIAKKFLNVPENEKMLKVRDYTSIKALLGISQNAKHCVYSIL